MILITMLMILLPTVYSMNMSSNNYNVNAYMSSSAGGYEDLPNNYTVYFGLDQTHIGNESGSSYRAETGLFYMVIGNIQKFTPSVALITFVVDIKDFGIEWIKANFT